MEIPDLKRKIQIRYGNSKSEMEILDLISKSGSDMEILDLEILDELRKFRKRWKLPFDKEILVITRIITR